MLRFRNGCSGAKVVVLKVDAFGEVKQANTGKKPDRRRWLDFISL